MRAGLGFAVSAALLTAAVWSGPVSAAAGATEGPSGKPVPQEQTGPPAYLSAEDQIVMARQEPLVRAASTLRTLVEQGADAGYAGMEITEDRVLLWWKGTPPPAVTAAARGAGVPVEARSAKYSRKELRAAADRLWRSAGVEHGGQIHAVKTFFDGSGLEAAVRPGQKRTLAPLPELDVPVHMVERDPVTLASRCDDGVPWYGGLAIRIDGSHSVGACGGNTNLTYNCTGGFGVHIGSTEYLLTAGHCGLINGTFRDGAGQYIGQATQRHRYYDLMLIQTDAGDRIWDGVPGVSDFSKPVVGWAWTTPGQSLCYSGATSGPRCGYTVDGAVDYVCGYNIAGGDECWYDMISARGAKAGTWIRPGDSGAPVFSLINNSAWTQAAGTVSGFISGAGDPNEWLVFQDFGTATRVWPGLDTINYLNPM
ncbi:hypothetical protein IL992_23475 [Microbispora sp. NEAU-D428]|uniref:hypothetical protein n=1 Tax=Microbispora sitophila TaxID=2771537 RepID=UPI0018670F93|nr:hypothetical protein [Microbispora sitophila]MBE3012135.1 hypothetical protein [Microbispora sitophila]